MKDEETPNSFVASTQKDCQLLSATGSVHWEWFYGWLQAFGGYFFLNMLTKEKARGH